MNVSNTHTQYKRVHARYEPVHELHPLAFGFERVCDLMLAFCIYGLGVGGALLVLRDISVRDI